MDPRAFNQMADDLDSKINVVGEFIEHAYSDGISGSEALVMKSHIERDFSSSQRKDFKEKIDSLYHKGKVTAGQRERMNFLLDKASFMTDLHFNRLTKIVPAKEAVSKPNVRMDLKGEPPVSGHEHLFEWLGAGGRKSNFMNRFSGVLGDKSNKHWKEMKEAFEKRMEEEKEKRERYGGF